MPTDDTLEGHSLRLHRIHGDGASGMKTDFGLEHVSVGAVDLWEAETEALRLAYMPFKPFGNGVLKMLRLWRALESLLQGKGSWSLARTVIASPGWVQTVETGQGRLELPKASEASEASDCQRLREELLQAKHRAFADATKVFADFQKRCAVDEFGMPLAPLLLWKNSQCMTGNHLLSLVSSVSYLQPEGTYSSGTEATKLLRLARSRICFFGSDAVFCFTLCSWTKVLLAMLLGRGFRFRAQARFYPNGIFAEWESGAEAKVCIGTRPALRSVSGKWIPSGGGGGGAA